MFGLNRHIIVMSCLNFYHNASVQSKCCLRSIVIMKHFEMHCVYYAGLESVCFYFSQYECMDNDFKLNSSEMHYSFWKKHIELSADLL